MGLARLIPTSGINGQEEAERGATSALLAVMRSVREFGLAMVKPLGAPTSQLGTYIDDKGLAEVVSRWEQLLRFAALRLGRELGADVQVQLSRKEAADPTVRFAAQAQSLVANGILIGAIRIPDAVAPIDVVADLRAGKVTVSVDIDAPREGRAGTRVNWLTRQLRGARRPSD